VSVVLVGLQRHLTGTGEVDDAADVVANAAQGMNTAISLP
jgi:hypothetical protein